jgi:hypothetical protein
VRLPALGGHGAVSGGACDKKHGENWQKAHTSFTGK